MSVHEKRWLQDYALVNNFSAYTDNKINGYVAVATDITESKKMEEWLKQLSLVDDLTGVRNRRMFNEKIQSELEKSKLNSERFNLTLILFDVDDFKAITITMVIP